MSRMNFLRNLFARSSCPVPTPGSPDREIEKRQAGLRLRHLLPLVGFVAPTVIVGYGIVIPRSCIAGVNSLTIGFATTILGACVTYIAGVRSALAHGAR